MEQRQMISSTEKQIFKRIPNAYSIVEHNA